MDEDVWMIKLPSMTVDCSCDIFVKEEGKRFVQEKYLKILFLREWSQAVKCDIWWCLVL